MLIHAMLMPKDLEKKFKTTEEELKKVVKSKANSTMTMSESARRVFKDCQNCLALAMRVKENLEEFSRGTDLRDKEIETWKNKCLQLENEIDNLESIVNGLKGDIKALEVLNDIAVFKVRNDFPKEGISPGFNLHPVAQALISLYDPRPRSITYDQGGAGCVQEPPQIISEDILKLFMAFQEFLKTYKR